MAGNQEDFLSDRDLAALAKEWLSSLFQPDAGQPSARTYEPPTYPQYSPDPTEEELAMAMLDSDEQITGPGIGEAITFMPPGGLAAKGLGAATKSLLHLIYNKGGYLRRRRLEKLSGQMFRDSEKARLGPDEYKRWRRRALKAQGRDQARQLAILDKDPSAGFKDRPWWEF